MPTEYFYASTISENAAAGQAWTLSGGATLVECCQTASDSKTLTNLVEADTVNTKILECSAWKRTTDDVALATAVGSGDTLNATSVRIVCRSTLGDPADTCTIPGASAATAVLRAYDTASQTWSTVGTPRNNATMTPNDAALANLDLPGWANSQPTLALIRAAGFNIGFRFNIDGSTVSSEATVDQVLLVVNYTAAPVATVTPRSRVAFRSWRGVR